MRIIHYHPRALVGDGGVSNSVRRLSAALARCGADAVIAYDAGDGVPPADQDDGVTWCPVEHRGAGEVRVPTGLAEALAEADLVVLNSAWTVHNERAAATALRVGVPYLLAPRGAYDPYIVRRRAWIKRAWWLAAEGRMVRRASAVHVFFPEQEQHVRALGFRGRIVVAPNGLSVPTDAAWDGGSGNYVLYLGRFDPEHKGLDLLLSGLALLPAGQRPKVRLVGPDWKGGRARVIHLVRDLGLEAFVTIQDAAYGPLKWQLFEKATAFIYPSRWEGFGNSLAEAAALGVPSLATPYPLATHLANRGAAVVADPSAEGLAAGLTAVQAFTPRQDVQRDLRQEFTWDNVAERWMDQTAQLK